MGAGADAGGAESGHRGNGGRRGGGRRGAAGAAGAVVVIDTMAPLEMFRRFLVLAAKQNVAVAYRRRRDVFPCSYGSREDGGGGQNGGRGRGRRTRFRILVDSDGDYEYVMDAVGHPVVRSGIGLLHVPPGGRVRKIDYTSSSGGTYLTWRWDPDHAYRRLGRVSGVATNWSLQYLGVAGVVTPEWAVGQAPILRAKRERAAKSWPAAPDLRTMGYSRRERRIAERRDLDSGAIQRFPTGYEEDNGKRGERNGAEIIQGLPTLDGAGTAAAPDAHASSASSSASSPAASAASASSAASSSSSASGRSQ